jgi:hypothetical protein
LPLVKKPSGRPIIPHWRKTRLNLQALVDLYLADAETAAVALPVDSVFDLIELFDEVLECRAPEDEKD